MRIITILVILTSSTLTRGQSLNLVPADSVNFEIIADTLIDIISFQLDSIHFDAEIVELCPCAFEKVTGIVSYRSSSVLIIRNKCLFIFGFGSDLFIRTGQMTNTKDKQGKYIWEFSTKRIKEKTASQYISSVKAEIAKAEIPKYESMAIVNDGTSYTFGNMEQNVFATTPRANWSDSIVELIKLSERLIR